MTMVLRTHQSIVGIIVGIIALLVSGVHCWQLPSQLRPWSSSPPPPPLIAPSTSSRKPQQQHKRKIKNTRRSFLKDETSKTLASVAIAILTSTTMIPTESVLAKIDVSGIRVEAAMTGTVGAPLAATVTSSGSTVDTIELAGISYTPAAMILQMAEQTASMEGMMRASVQDIQSGKTTKERVENGSKGTGPGVVRRQDVTSSVRIMIANAKVSLIAPRAGAVLEEIPAFLNRNNGEAPAELSAMEYQIVAAKYAASRDEFQTAFLGLSPEAQAEGRKTVRALRAQDEQRMREQQRRN